MQSTGKWLAANIGVMCGLGVLLGSLTLNVALGLHIRNSASVRPGEVGGTKVGAKVTPVALVESPGGLRELGFHGEQTILYIMSPTCGWCARNIENIRTIGRRYRVVGVSPTADKLAAYREKNPLPFEIVVPDSTRLPKWLDLGVTPQTVVVNKSGVVERVWVGALDGSKKTGAEKFFGMSLPGLLEVPHLPPPVGAVIVSDRGRK